MERGGRGGCIEQTASPFIENPIPEKQRKMDLSVRGSCPGLLCPVPQFLREMNSCPNEMLKVSTTLGNLRRASKGKPYRWRLNIVEGHMETFSSVRT